MISNFFKKYIIFGYNLDNLLPNLMDNNWFELNKLLENRVLTKQNSINILIENIIVNIKFVNGEIVYNKNYEQLISKNISSIQIYKNTFIIKDSKYRILNPICENFYSLDNLLKLDVFSYNKGLCFYKESGIGFKYVFYNIKISVIIIVENKQYNEEFLNEDLTFKNFKFTDIELVNSNCWIYQGYHKIKSTKLISLDLEFDNETKIIDLNAYENSNKKNEKIKPIEFDFGEIKF